MASQTEKQGKEEGEMGDREGREEEGRGESMIEPYSFQNGLLQA